MASSEENSPVGIIESPRLRSLVRDDSISPLLGFPPPLVDLPASIQFRHSINTSSSTDLEPESADNVTMADPFEVRMRFSSQLQHLNATVVSHQKAAAYAMKYKDMDEDLHSCILEQLERVLQCLENKGHIENQVVVQIEEVLKDRETSAHDAGLSSPVQGDQDLGDMPPSQTIPKPGRPSAPGLDKRQIEQRIEEDRERHKRLREDIWAIRDRDAEIDRLWEETSDLGEDDHTMGREEFLAREAAVAQQCPHYTPRGLDDLYGRKDQNGASGRGHGNGTSH
ncbi:conserved hypothetical protein [Verticillium alfalfae VaMs.102]|uniref:Uncharacterized protein n=1 Tax=Verticillium alfalfae (strain VaMs.102 / ATCC MYA-4576 / FGSC 10136) TaxID=526221 RepID=C9SUW7_VERA1|nr:conserved hypothetical protein [Verticillium alfalfae VaMs.102]EEY22582.1 conserved hypothetical protein [Verticillium alfalfae VaMs.102]